jgi:hypothetical protein
MEFLNYSRETWYHGVNHYILMVFTEPYTRQCIELHTKCLMPTYFSITHLFRLITIITFSKHQLLSNNTEYRKQKVNIAHIKSSVGIATDYGLDDRSSVPSGGKKCFLLAGVQTGYEAHLSSYAIGIGSSFHEVKAAGA